MSKELTTEEMIEQYLKNGGKVTKLRYASEADQKKASRRWYHREKALNGSERSQKILEAESEKKKTMIFSTTEQWQV